MSNPSLCYERLQRVLKVLDVSGGRLPLRTFTRTFSVRKWEIEAAAALGWVEIITRKPPIGRPSRLVLKVNNPQTAKLPPYRREIEKPISIRHERFALFSTHAVPYGSRFLARQGLGLPCITDAYQRAFPSATNRRAAAASASRLKRCYDVRIARAWFYARFDGDIRRDEPMPSTPRAIWQRLKQAGSWRV